MGPVARTQAQLNAPDGLGGSGAGVSLSGAGREATTGCAPGTKAHMGGPATRWITAVRRTCSLKELERHGYLVRERERRADGTFGAAAYFITDMPEPPAGSPPSNHAAGHRQGQSQGGVGAAEPARSSQRDPATCLARHLTRYHAPTRQGLQRINMLV